MDDSSFPTTGIIQSFSSAIETEGNPKTTIICNMGNSKIKTVVQLAPIPPLQKKVPSKESKPIEPITFIAGILILLGVFALFSLLFSAGIYLVLADILFVISFISILAGFILSIIDLIRISKSPEKYKGIGIDISIILIITLMLIFAFALQTKIYFTDYQRH